MPTDFRAHIREGKRLKALFDANVLLDVLLLRKGAYPAAQTLSYAEVGEIQGYVSASVFGVVCHRGTTPGSGRKKRERQLAREIMSLLQVLPLTEKVIAASLGYEDLSFEDAMVAASGDSVGIDVILTYDQDFVRNHGPACKPQTLVSALEAHLGRIYDCRAVRVTKAGDCRIEIYDTAGNERQTIPLASFPTLEEAERVAGLWRTES